jgi:hypothetical protein
MVNRLLSSALFVVGCAAALAFSWMRLSPVWTSYARIPSLLDVDSISLDFQCRSAECASCLHGIQDTPDAIVLTGGSTFSYALNLEQFAKLMPRPVVSCLRNDSRMDMYRMFFSHARFNQAGQAILHGYNSWAINSPGTWVGDLADAFFALNLPPKRQPPAWLPERWHPADRRWRAVQARIDLILLYAQMYLTRTAAEGMMEWRTRFRVQYPFYAAHRLQYFPLSAETHQQRKLGLMKRWFGISAYTRGFMIDAATPHSADEIVARHEGFFAAIAPTRRVVFFPGPELSVVFPERVRAVSAEAKRIMLATIAGTPGAHHVEIDYQACGLRDTDFWYEALMYFDVPHANPDATAKLTACIATALTNAGLERMLSEN